MSIGIVIPVRNLERDFDLIRINLNNCLKNRVRVWLIFDSGEASQSVKWNELLNSFDRDFVSFISGNFDSPGLARNSALSKLNVDWVGFCDSDDLMNIEELLKVVEFGELNCLDLVVANLEVRDKLGLAISSVHGVSKNLALPLSLSIFPAFTRIIYRVDFVKNIDFPDFQLGEDQCFLFAALCNSPKIGYIDTIIYSYFRNVGGQLTSKKENCLEILKSVCEIDVINERYKLEFDLLASIMKMRLRITFLKMSGFKPKIQFKVIFESLSDLFQHPINNTKAVFYVLNYRRKLN